MWSTITENISGDRQLKYRVYNQAQPVSYLEVLQLWQQDLGFRKFFIDLLMDAPYPTYRWETPPLNANTASRPFEFVLINSPALARKPDEQAFNAYFDPQARGGIVEFLNLGRDAVMVVPCPQTDSAAYVHLGVFMRDAPDAQKHALWQQVGSAMVRRLNAKPVWLSTAGGGVAWLHVRLDDRPKYYQHRPYREMFAQT